jgi:hypothetical protein
MTGATAPGPCWWGRGRRPWPLRASTCSASAPHLLRLPSRARALASTAGCPQTSFFSLLCTPVVLTCPWLTSRTSQRLTNAYLTFIHSQSLQTLQPSTSNPAQQPGDQPTTRRTELRHGTFCGILSAVCLGLLLPSIFRGAFFFGLPGRLGIAQPGRRAAAQGGAQGGGRPHPSQKGQMAQKNVRFGQLGAARFRRDELIERPEGQGTQDAGHPAHKK